MKDKMTSYSLRFITNVVFESPGHEIKCVHEKCNVIQGLMLARCKGFMVTVSLRGETKCRESWA
jgi:hypothetical protein